jgi:hypothetical protein
MCAARLFAVGSQPDQNKTARPADPPGFIGQQFVFMTAFGFAPKDLGVYGRKKEVVIHMGTLAAHVREQAWMRNKYWGSTQQKTYAETYDRALREFDAARACIAAFDPKFARQLPHWTEYPNNVQAWIQGARVEVRPAAGEIELLPPPRLE